MIGQHGLTTAVLREITRALEAHELIKVRVLNDDRRARAAMFDEICNTLACAPVQHIGKLFVLWRPAPEKEAAPPERQPAKAKKAARKAAGKITAKITNRIATPHGAPKGKPLSVTDVRNMRGHDTKKKSGTDTSRTTKTTRPRRRFAD